VRRESWPIDPSEFQNFLKSLRFKYFKWDAKACGRCLILPESIVLTPGEHEDAVRISEKFGEILERLEQAIIQRTDILVQLGIPAPVIPLLQSAQPVDLQLARYDLFLTVDGRWMISEFNEDVPGGFNEAQGIPDMLGAHLPGVSFAGDLRQAVIRALAPFKHVALLFATAYAEDLQHMLIIERWLQEAGHETSLASPAHLDVSWRRAKIFGRTIDAAVRYYPGEWFQHLPNRDAWEKSLPRLPMMNPLRRLIRQSKRLYAFWRDPELLNAVDRAFIEAHTPRTVPFEMLSDWGDRSNWVLKRAFGRMGDAVVMGSLVSEEAWAKAIAEAAKNPTEWLMQEKFEVASLDLHERLLFPGLGVYLVNKKFAGYYSRAAFRPFIDYEAYHVATVVEPSPHPWSLGHTQRTAETSADRGIA
jgi:hypothetical protein